MPFLTRPERQLKFLRDLSWFDPDRLEGFAERACEILLSNKLLVGALPGRVGEIRQELNRRIGALQALQRELGPVRVYVREKNPSLEETSVRTVARASDE